MDEESEPVMIVSLINFVPVFTVIQREKVTMLKV